MKLQAIIDGLKLVPEGSRAEVFTDYYLLVSSMEKGWYKNWIKNGWKTKDGRPVQNKDLWLIILNLMKTRRVRFVRAKGYANIRARNCKRALKLARSGGIFAVQQKDTFFMKHSEKPESLMTKKQKRQMRAGAKKKRVKARAKKNKHS